KVLETDDIIPLLSQEGIFRSNKEIEDIENLLGSSRDWEIKVTG
ncbi:unnamed protein product, partial [marine sediment metagenome]